MHHMQLHHSLLQQLSQPCRHLKSKPWPGGVPPRRAVSNAAYKRMRQNVQRKPMQKLQQKQYKEALLQQVQRVEGDKLVVELQQLTPRDQAEQAQLQEQAALNQELQAQISTAVDWQQLQHIVLEHGPELNYQTVSQLTLKLGLLVRSGQGPYSPGGSPGAEPAIRQAEHVDQYKGLLERVVHLIANRTSWFTGIQYAEVAFGLSAAGYENPAFWAVLCASSERKLLSCNGRHLALLMQGAIWSGHVPSRQWLNKTEIQCSKHWHATSVSDAAAILWSWARVAYTPNKTFMGRVLPRMLSLMKKRYLNAQQLLQVLYLVARLSQHHPGLPWMNAWCSAFKPHIHKVAPGVLSDVLLCLASLQYTPQPSFAQPLLLELQRRGFQGSSTSAPMSAYDTTTTTTDISRPTARVSRASSAPARGGPGGTPPPGAQQYSQQYSQAVQVGQVVRQQPAAGYKSLQDMLGADDHDGIMEFSEFEAAQLAEEQQQGSSRGTSRSLARGRIGSDDLLGTGGVDDGLSDADAELMELDEGDGLIATDDAAAADDEAGDSEQVGEESDTQTDGFYVDEDSDEQQVQQQQLDERGESLLLDDEPDQASAVSSPFAAAVVAGAGVGAGPGQGARGNAEEEEEEEESFLMDDDEESVQVVSSAPASDDKQQTQGRGQAKVQPEPSVVSQTQPITLWPPSSSSNAVPDASPGQQQGAGGVQRVPVLLMRPNQGMVPDLACCGPMSDLRYPAAPGQYAARAAGQGTVRLRTPLVKQVLDSQQEQAQGAAVQSAASTATDFPSTVSESTVQRPARSGTPASSQQGSGTATVIDAGGSGPAPGHLNCFSAQLQARHLGTLAWSVSTQSLPVTQHWLDAYMARVLDCLPDMEPPVMIDILYGLSRVVSMPSSTLDTVTLDARHTASSGSRRLDGASTGIVSSSSRVSEMAAAPDVLKGVLQGSEAVNAAPRSTSTSLGEVNTSRASADDVQGSVVDLSVQPDFVLALATALTDEVHNLEPDALSQLAVALARFGCHPGPSWLEATAAACQLRMSDFSAWSLPDMLVGLVSLGHQPSAEWWASFELAALPVLAHCPASHVCRVAWGLAAARHKPSVKWLHELLVTALSQFKRMDEEELCSLIWSFAKLKHRPGINWLASYSQELSSRMGLLSAQQLCDVMWGLAAVGHQPTPEWLQQVEGALTIRLPSATPAQLAVILWAFKQWRFMPSSSGQLLKSLLTPGVVLA